MLSKEADIPLIETPDENSLKKMNSPDREKLR